MRFWRRDVTHILIALTTLAAVVAIAVMGGHPF